jgi:hypothetical protein
VKAWPDHFMQTYHQDSDLYRHSGHTSKSFIYLTINIREARKHLFGIRIKFDRIRTARFHIYSVKWINRLFALMSTILLGRKVW